MCFFSSLCVLFFFFFFYLFGFGCAESLLLRGLCSGCEQGLLSSLVCGLLIGMASLVTEHVL